MIFLPKEINVGYQERYDTYTKKLAYIIYFDEDKTLRKEKSWNDWRDKKIENNIFENVPTSGFVLNKKAGGGKSSWNNRQSWIRIYDPRGFEFEISVDNLLYIYEHCTSIKGKGIEGEFVYGWSGTELILIPVDDPDYEVYKDFSDTKFNKTIFKPKDLKIGFLYKNKDFDDVVYLGKHHTKTQRVKTKQFFFWNVTKGGYYQLEERSTIDKYLLAQISEEKVENYLDILENQKVKNKIVF